MKWVFWTLFTLAVLNLACLSYYVLAAEMRPCFVPAWLALNAGFIVAQLIKLVKARK